MVEGYISIVQAIIFSAIAAIGFAMMFNVPRRYLIYCGFLGAIGNGLRFTLLESGVIIEWSSFAAAIVIGLMGTYIARKKRIYPKIIMIPATIPMFPGVHAYTAIIGLINLSQLGYSEALMGEVVTETLKAFFIVSTLAIGLALPAIWFSSPTKKL